jgi:hypothetical protein
VDDCSDAGSGVADLGVEFADPSGEVDSLVVLAFEDELLTVRTRRNSVYVASVIAPASASPINSEAASTEIVDD